MPERDAKGRFVGGGGGGEDILVRLIGDATGFRKMMLEASAMAGRLEKRMVSLGSTLTKTVTLPLVAIGAASVKAFADFDHAMTKSTSIMKATTQEVEAMRETALSLASEGPQGPDQLAESYFFLASAGLNAKESIEALPVVQKFATAGAFDMALATDLLTDAQSALGLETSRMIELSDALVKANTLANASVQQFSEALTNDAGATMKSFNIDMNEGLAVLAAFADQGIKGNVAGSSFGRMLRLMTTGARENKKAFEQYNIEVFDAQGNLNNLADVIGDMEVAFKDMSVEAKGAALEQLGFNALAQKAILPLLGTSDAIREYEKGLRNATGTTQSVADKQMESFTNQLKVLKNEITVVAIEIGKELIPIVKDMVKWVKDAVQNWKELDPGIKSFIIDAAKMAAVAGPLLIVFGKLVGVVKALTVAMMTNPFIAIAAAIAIVIEKTIGWKKAFEGLGDFISKAVQGWMILFKAVEDAINRIEKAAGESNKRVANNLRKRGAHGIADLIDPEGNPDAGFGGGLIDLAIDEGTKFFNRPRPVDESFSINDAVKSAEETHRNRKFAVKSAFTQTGFASEEARELQKESMLKAEEEARNALAEATRLEREEKERLAEAAKKAREEEERFQRSIKGFGIEGVGRGIDALQRIAESRRNRGLGQNQSKGEIVAAAHRQADKVDLSKASLGSPELKKLVELTKIVIENTGITAEKEEIIIKDANISQTGDA